MNRPPAIRCMVVAYEAVTTGCGVLWLVAAVAMPSVREAAPELCAVRRLDTAVRTIAVAATTLGGTVYRSFHDGLEPGQPWYSRLDWSAWGIVVMTWPTMAAGRALRRSVLRSFDFGADEMAVAITRHPEGLASALRKLRDDPTVVAGLTPQTAPLWFEPIPNDDTYAAFEWDRYAYAPTLDERLDRLASVAHLED